MASRPRRALALTGEILLLLLALIVLSVAATGQSLTDEEGIVQVDDEDFSTDSHAIVGDSWDEAIYSNLGLTETVHIEVTSDKEVFVGFTSPEQAEELLDGVEHTAVHRATDAQGPTVDQIQGEPPRTAAADADIWEVSSQGSGTQVIDWNVEGFSEEVTPVVMNADGSAGIDLHVKIGYDLPALGGIVAGLYIAGTLLGVLAVWLMVRTIRKGRKPVTA